MKNFAAIGLILLTGCVVSPQDAANPGAPPALALRQDAPRLAMLEHVLGEYFTADITDPPTVCAAVHDGREEVTLSVEEETALIERFPQLAPMSRCTSTPQGWRDVETGEPAMVFTLHSFTCASDIQCTGWAGYRSSASNSMSRVYTADWRGGEWRFTSDPALIAE